MRRPPSCNCNCRSPECTSCTQALDVNMQECRLTMTPPTWPYFDDEISETSRSAEPSVSWPTGPSLANCSGLPPNTAYRPVVAPPNAPNYDINQKLYAANLGAIGGGVILRRPPENIEFGSVSLGTVPVPPFGGGFNRHTCEWLWNDVKAIKSVWADTESRTGVSSNLDYDPYEPLNPMHPESPWGRVIDTATTSTCGDCVHIAPPCPDYRDYYHCATGLVYTSACLYNAWGYPPNTYFDPTLGRNVYFQEWTTGTRYWVLRWKAVLVVSGDQNFYTWRLITDNFFCPTPEGSYLDLQLTTSYAQGTGTNNTGIGYGFDHPGGLTNLFEIGGYRGDTTNAGGIVQIEYAKEINCSTDFTEGITLDLNRHIPKLSDPNGIVLSSFPDTIHIDFDVEPV